MRSSSSSEVRSLPGGFCLTRFLVPLNSGNQWWINLALGSYVPYVRLKIHSTVTMGLNSANHCTTQFSFVLNGRHCDDCFRRTVLLPLRDSSAHARKNELQATKENFVICWTFHSEAHDHVSHIKCRYSTLKLVSPFSMTLYFNSITIKNVTLVYNDPCFEKI
jgi:hypothetical protein